MSDIENRFEANDNGNTHVDGVVEPQTPVQLANALDLVLAQVEGADVQVLRQPGGVVALGDDSDAPLGSPPEQDLGRGLAVLLSNGLDSLVVEQQRGVLSLLHVQFDERQGAERRIRRDGHAVALRELDERLLRQVRVVLDLQRGGLHLGVAEQVQQQRALEVGDADAAGEALLLDGLERAPRLLDGGVAVHDLVVLVGPTGWVPD